MKTAKDILRKAVGKKPDLTDSPASTSQSKLEAAPVSRQDLFRYRYQHGVNLGGIFVLEKWLFPSMFEKSAQGGSEFEAVKASLAINGLDATITKWENHWSNSLKDKDIDFLVNEAHCNTVRIPIGYFTLGPEFCSGTPFEGEAAQVYHKAWSHFLTICDKLAKANIGSLLDMHALPGGANGDSHSGTSSAQAGLWGSKHNLDLAKSCLIHIIKRIALGDIPNCVGLQICNEAAWGAKGMYDFYDSILKEISPIDNSFPVYISDAWNLDTALAWSRKQNTLTSTTNLIIIDTHRYYTFDEKHKSKSPQEIIRLIPEALRSCPAGATNVHRDGAAPVFIGEYSCVMDTRSWSHVAETDKSDLTRQFGQAQCQRWHEQCCGSAFWTFQMDWMPGGGWGFVDQTRKGNIKAPTYLTLPGDEIKQRIESATVQRDSIRREQITAHSLYWQKTSPGQYFEHWRFEAGWDQGWADALTFFGMKALSGVGSFGGDSIGCLSGWIRKRIMELGHTGGFGWEYEQGFRHAVSKAEGILLQ